MWLPPLLGPRASRPDKSQDLCQFHCGLQVLRPDPRGVGSPNCLVWTIMDHGSRSFLLSHMTLLSGLLNSISQYTLPGSQVCLPQSPRTSPSVHSCRTATEWPGSFASLGPVPLLVLLIRGPSRRPEPSGWCLGGRQSLPSGSEEPTAD